MRTEKSGSAVIVVCAALLTGCLSSAAWALAPQHPEPSAFPAGSSLMLNYEDEDLHDFINAIAAYLGISPIIIDPKVEGKVTVRSSSPMPRENVLPLFRRILKDNSAALVKDGGVFRIVPVAAADRFDAFE